MPCQTCRVLTSNVRTLGLASHRLMARLATPRGAGGRVRYGLPVGGAIVTVGLVDTTMDVLPGGGAFLLLLAPVMAASAALGFRPGMLALVVCAVGAWLLVPLRGHPWYTEPAHIARFALFLLEGLFVAALAFVVRATASPSPRVQLGAEDTGVDPLTPREIEVLAIAATGLQIHEIARRLFVSRETVKSHLAHAYAKLGARNRADAVARALQAGLIELVPGEGHPSAPPANGVAPEGGDVAREIRSRARRPQLP
jgi:DNA-binding CsgD family transcriptional regulator